MLGPILLSLLPLGLFVFFLGKVQHLPAISSYVLDWAPQIGLTLSFRLDALALLMACLISGIGFFIFIYAGAYLKGHPFLKRFYAFLTLFMLAMLGVVLSDNLIGLFVCWELTSITSYLLIGFNHESQKSRDSALMALLTTGIGGLAMLAGFLMLGSAAGTFEISQIILQGGALKNAQLYPLFTGLILLGAMTKSAQFPFHYWLPNAMAGPTPVSAYLHSATMVKAGIFLMARLTPVLGGTPFWMNTLCVMGALTVLLAAWMSFGQKDIKGILAYTTLAALGTLTMLLGVGTPKAFEAFLFFLFAHALYKASFFMIAGTVDHETGTRDLSKLGKLAKFMPTTAWAAVAAGIAFSGLPPTLGFISKELAIEATLHGGGNFAMAWMALPALFIGSVAFVYLTCMLVHTVFWGDALKVSPVDASVRKEHIHDGGWGFYLGPVCLAFLGILFGLAPGLLSHALVEPASEALLGFKDSYHPALWHGLTPPLFITVAVIATGLVLYRFRESIIEAVSKITGNWHYGIEDLYKKKVELIPVLSPKIFGFFQNGYLRKYVASILAFTIVIVSWPLLRQQDWSLAERFWNDVNFEEIVLVFSLVFASILTLLSRKTFVALAATGVVGLGVAAFYVLYGAPDLAITQVLVEALSLILVILVLFHFSRVSIKAPKSFHLLSLGLSMGIGLLFAVGVLLSLNSPYFERISGYFSENSYLLAKGKNIVNVILVDFRGWDTMGEIVVLALASLGVYALVRWRREGDAP
ncbi:DUF4040 domain-containing protein [bacterium]|nr:DUF4040 domain-containing protein [bacterium]